MARPKFRPKMPDDRMAEYVRQTEESSQAGVETYKIHTYFAVAGISNRGTQAALEGEAVSRKMFYATRAQWDALYRHHKGLGD